MKPVEWRVLAFLLLHTICSLHDLISSIKLQHTYSIYSAGIQSLDSVVIIFTFVSIRISHRPPDNSYTYGYHRWLVLSAFSLVTVVFLTASLQFSNLLQFVMGPGTGSVSVSSVAAASAGLKSIQDELGNTMNSMAAPVAATKPAMFSLQFAIGLIGIALFASSFWKRDNVRAPIDDTLEGLFVHSFADFSQAISSIIAQKLAIPTAAGIIATEPMIMSASNAGTLLVVISTLSAILSVLISIPLFKRTTLTLLQVPSHDMLVVVQSRLTSLRKQYAFELVESAFWSNACNLNVGTLRVRIGADMSEQEILLVLTNALQDLISDLTIQVDKVTSHPVVGDSGNVFGIQSTLKHAGSYDYAHHHQL